MDSKHIDALTARLPAGLYDVAANETWLEEMAVKGYAIQRIQGTRVYFAEGEAKAVRFRMQPMRKKEEAPDEERLALYRDLGWTYVGTVKDGFHLWLCEDPAAPELDTDPVVQADGYRYLKHNMKCTILLEGVFLLVMFGMCGMANTEGGNGLRYILRDSLPFQVPMLFMMILCGCIGAIADVRTMHRLLKRLEAGIPLERTAPYRLKQCFLRISLICMILYVILSIAKGFFPGDNGDIVGWSARAGDGPKAGIVYVDITKLDPPSDEVEFETVLTRSHELASRITEVEMHQIKHVTQGHYVVVSKAETTCYDLRFHFLVSPLVEDICSRFQYWGPFEEIETPYLDRFLVTSRTGHSNVAIAVKGKRVMELFYSGQTDLRTLDVYLAELLKQ